MHELQYSGWKLWGNQQIVIPHWSGPHCVQKKNVKKIKCVDIIREIKQKQVFENSNMEKK